MFSTCFSCDANALFSVMFVCDNPACGRLFCQKCGKGFLKTSCPRCGHAGTLKPPDELKKLFQPQSWGNVQPPPVAPAGKSAFAKNSSEPRAALCPHCGGDLPTDARKKKYDVCRHCRNQLYWSRTKPYPTQEAAAKAMRRAAQKARNKKQAESRWRAIRGESSVLGRLIGVMQEFVESKGGWMSSPQPIKLAADTRLDAITITDVSGLADALIGEFGSSEPPDAETLAFEGRAPSPYDWVNICGLGTIGAIAQYIEQIDSAGPANSPRMFSFGLCMHLAAAVASIDGKLSAAELGKVTTELQQRGIPESQAKDRFVAVCRRIHSEGVEVWVEKLCDMLKSPSEQNQADGVTADDLVLLLQHLITAGGGEFSDKMKIVERFENALRS